MTHPIELICIIDDDSMYTNLIVKMIKVNRLCKELLTFKNGKEALAYFSEIDPQTEKDKIPQIILLDLEMPVMDGWQFLEQLESRKLQQIDDSVLYIVSSSINPADKERSNSIKRVKDFLEKPISPDGLAKMLMQQTA